MTPIISRKPRLLSVAARRRSRRQCGSMTLTAFPQGAIIANPALIQNVRFDDADTFPQGIIIWSADQSPWLPIALMILTLLYRHCRYGWPPQTAQQTAPFNDSDLFFATFSRAGFISPSASGRPSLISPPPSPRGSGDAERKKCGVKWRDTVAEAEARLLEKQRRSLTLGRSRGRSTSKCA